jgi:hypothetical protein
VMGLAGTLTCVGVGIVFLGVICGALYDARRGWITFAVCFVLPALILGGLGAYVCGLGGRHPRIFVYQVPGTLHDAMLQAVGFTIPVAILGLGFWLGTGGPRRLRLWTVTNQDQAECAKCRYPLRGLTGYRCPECGQPFDPKNLTRWR